MGGKLKNISAMLIFGTIGIFVKNIELASSEIALLRGIIGGIVLIIVSILVKNKISFKDIKSNLLLLLLSGGAIGLNWIFLFQAYKYTTISNATLSYYFAPVFVMLLSPVILKEKLTAKKIFCVVCAMLGMICIVGNSNGGAEGRNDFLGIVYGLTAAAFYASVILMNKFLKNLKSLETTYIQLILAAVVLMPYVFTVEGFNIFRIPASSIPYILILGMVHTGLAYLLYFSSLKELKGQTIAVLSYIDPISAVIISAIFLREKMGLLQIAGGILILGSTFVSELTKNKGGNK
ncbi:DMT family transporter [uncultured Fusobacterium sp.]|uniref:DMT family transporter n=1 Tax=uncultured Fusobacterium sp. TaxID=159267 RepID=UPI000F6D4815|nr:DMT family transporter [Fusobacterium varium]VEH38391.1 threonine and homoserine efflux system [Fusobacterium varium]